LELILGIPTLCWDCGDDDALNRALAMGINKAQDRRVDGAIDEMTEAIEDAHRRAAWNCPKCECEKLL
jgi:hypothetical protein